MSSWNTRASSGLATSILGITLLFAPAGSRAAPDPEALDSLLARALPSPEELEAAADLAEARALVAASGLGLADGISLGVAGGVRRPDSGGEDDGDVLVEAEAPLLGNARARDALSSALAECESLLPLAARRSALYEVESLHAEAWAAERLEGLAREALAAIDQWLAMARERVREGADAPYEAELVAIERRQAELDLRSATARRIGAWGALKSRVDLPAAPTELAEPAIEPPPDAPELPADALAARSLAARAALASAAATLEHARSQSRWSLRSELAREGDEEVGRIGFGYRLPRSGERSAAAASLETRLAAIARDVEIERLALASRFAAARALVEGASAGSAADSVTKSRVALQALVTEGKARPSEVLPLRRQLLAAEAAEFERRAAVARATAELSYLASEVAP